MTVVVEKIASGSGYEYMKVGETGTVLQYDYDRSRVYVKDRRMTTSGINFGTWVQLSQLKVVEGDLDEEFRCELI